MQRLPSLVAVLLLLLLQLPAIALDLPAGMRLAPPRELDLTYQLIPAYDEKRKVIAGWREEKLQYFVSVSRLPAGYLDADTYLAALVRDLRHAWPGIVVGKRTTYLAENGLSGTAVELSVPSDGSNLARTLVAHFIADKRISFLAIATTNSAPAELVVDETVRLFRTAMAIDPSSTAGLTSSNEAELVGIWSTEESLPDGKRLASRIDLKSDLSFATTVALNEKAVFVATGVWSRNSGKLYWTYTSSNPELPVNRRLDEDQIVSVERSTLTLRSSLSNKERVFTRVGANAR